MALKPSSVLFFPFQVRDFPIPPGEAAPSRKESSVIPPVTVFFSTLPLPRAHCRAVGLERCVFFFAPTKNPREILASSHFASLCTKSAE